MTEELITNLATKHFEGTKNLDRKIYNQYKEDSLKLKLKYRTKTFNKFFPLLEIFTEKLEINTDLGGIIEETKDSLQLSPVNRDSSRDS